MKGSENRVFRFSVEESAMDGIFRGPHLSAKLLFLLTQTLQGAVRMSSNKNPNLDNLDRRSLILGMGAAAAAFTPLAVAMEGEVQHHAKHDHSKHSPQQPGVLDAVNGCLDKGQRCIAHCLQMFIEGDVSVAECAAKVHEMQAICGAFSYLLAANSTHIKAAAALCDAVCDECADECRKHDQHIECRECAEACETTIAAVRKAFA